MLGVSRSLRLTIALLAALALLWCAAPAHAVLYAFSSGDRAATANFTRTGGTLTITLTNTATADALVPVDILTAVFFDLAGAPSLTPGAATVAPGSFTFGDPGHPSGVTNVSSEWAYVGNLTGVPSNPHYGISSTGLNLFGPGNRFDSVGNLQGPDSPDGLQYGITTAGDNISTGNGGISDTGLIKNSVAFTLTGLPTNYDLTNALSNVWFQYGTDLSEPRFPSNGNPPPPPPNGPIVPEPVSAGLSLLGLGALALRLVGRRR